MVSNAASLAGTTLLNRYYLRELVGSGGAADVYLTWDRLRAAKMAVKILRRDLRVNEQFLRQFTKEAEILNELQHPNIVRLFEFNQDGDIVFIVMDWVEGASLRQVISANLKPFTPSSASHILAPVCSALHYAHQNQIYHCDIKPANILLHTDGRVLLSDFGIASLANETGGGGTPPYMAPEQFTGDTIDARTDVYALGITLYEMLSGGQLPYCGESDGSKGSTSRERIAWEHLNLTPPSLRKINPAIPESVEKTILRAIDKEPRKRFSDVMSFHETLDRACGMSEPVNNDNFASTQALRTLNMPEKPPIAKPVGRTKEEVFPPLPPKPTTVPGRQSVQLPALFCRTGEFSGKFIPIPVGQLLIGRGTGSQLQLHDTSVSRQHAEIIRSARGVYVRDAGSLLGTYVNGQRIIKPVLLKDRDVIQIGYQQVFEFRCR